MGRVRKALTAEVRAALGRHLRQLRKAPRTAFVAAEAKGQRKPETDAGLWPIFWPCSPTG
ncbi:hypothetical protein [Streptomyces sp. NBC_01314]|uniref:hypothetical protein n=1 Tax=Streptomyces sp. NBC_01314 TaxID=2903821 RepID=UPI00308FC901|nr:hypothetical protein OG622_13280 [Streptomyces sp. NBC_01314]